MKSSKQNTALIAGSIKLGVIACLFAAFTFSSSANAQCKRWVKLNCLPTVQTDGFKFTGQMSTAVLVEGDEADMALSFSQGKTYRLMVCSQEILGEVEFQLKDKDGSVLFDSKDSEEQYFDFNVESTQELILHISVPKSETTHELTHHGCVSIMQGYK